MNVMMNEAVRTCPESRPQTTTAESISVTTSTTTTSSAGSSGTTTFIINAGNDSVFAPPSFRGTDSENAGAWLCHFEKYAAYRGSAEADKLHLLALLLQDAASDWYDNLDDEIKADWTFLKDAFTKRFEDTEVLRWRKFVELHQRVQGPSENVNDYITVMCKLAKSLGINGEQERYVVQRGLRPELLAQVILTQPTTVDDVLKAARVSETADTIAKMSTTPSNDAALDKLNNDLAATRQIIKENHTTQRTADEQEDDGRERQRAAQLIDGATRGDDNTTTLCH